MRPEKRFILASSATGGEPQLLSSRAERGICSRRFESPVRSGQAPRRICSGARHSRKQILRRCAPQNDEQVMIRRFRVGQPSAGVRLDLFLVSVCSDLSRSRVQKLIGDGAVRVAGAPGSRRRPRDRRAARIEELLEPGAARRRARARALRDHNYLLGISLADRPHFFDGGRSASEIRNELPTRRRIWTPTYWSCDVEATVLFMNLL